MKSFLTILILTSLAFACKKKETNSESSDNSIQTTTGGNSGNMNNIEVECYSGCYNAYLNVTWNYGTEYAIYDSISNSSSYNDSIYHKTMYNAHFIQNKTINTDSIIVRAWSGPAPGQLFGTPCMQNTVTVRVDGVVKDSWIATDSGMARYIKIK